MWELLQTHPFSGSRAQHWWWEWKTPIQFHVIETILSPMSPLFFFFFFLCTVIRITFLHKIIPKYKSVYPKRRGGQIHGYSLCLKSFHLKLLQIMPSSDLTSVPQSLDHCLKLSVTVFFLPSLLLALFSCLLSHILLNTKKFYGD